MHVDLALCITILAWTNCASAMQIAIVLEYMDGGSLGDVLQKVCQLHLAQHMLLACTAMLSLFF